MFKKNQNQNRNRNLAIAGAGALGTIGLALKGKNLLRKSPKVVKDQNVYRWGSQYRGGNIGKERAGTKIYKPEPSNNSPASTNKILPGIASKPSLQTQKSINRNSQLANQQLEQYRSQILKGANEINLSSLNKSLSQKYKNNPQAQSTIDWVKKNPKTENERLFLENLPKDQTKVNQDEWFNANSKYKRQLISDLKENRLLPNKNSKIGKELGNYELIKDNSLQKLAKGNKKRTGRVKKWKKKKIGLGNVYEEGREILPNQSVKILKNNN